MPMDKKRAGNLLTIIMRTVPVLLVAALITALALLMRNKSVEDVLRYTPASLPLAAAAFIGMYAIKSLSIVFPLMVLYIGVGTIFPIPVAVAVNVVGLCVCVTLPYLLGGFAGKEWMDEFLKKYQKADKLHELGSSNEWFLSYILRVVNLFPGDVVSLLLGASGVSFIKYLIGSLAGLLPTCLAATFLGASILEPRSPEFLTSLGLTVAISLLSIVIYAALLRRNKK